MHRKSGNKNNFFFFYTSLCFTFALLSCNESKETQINDTVTQIISTNTTIPSFTSPTNTLVSTQVSTNTLTSISTLNTLDAEVFISNLLKNNGGCSFPCLWGNEPGVTTSGSLKNFFDLLQTFQIKSVDIDVVHYSESSSAYVDFAENYIISSIYKVHNSNPIAISLFISSTTPVPPTPTFMVEKFNYYSISNILSTYGEPQQILIGPNPFDPDRPNDRVPFNVLIFNPNKNFFIEYLLTRESDDMFFIGCPTNPVEISILTWEQSKIKSIEELLNLDLDLAFWGINKYNYDEYYRNLEDVMILKDDFYNTFSKPQARDCLKVEKKFWPYN